MAQRIPFTKEDEEHIASAGLWGLIAAITSIGTAILGLLLTVAVWTGAGSLLQQIISTTLNLILGVWLLQASNAFRRVALTDVNDEANLLEGFSKLRSYFMLSGIIIIIALVLMGLFLLFLLSCGMMMGSLMR